MTAPFLTVCLPVFNGSGFLERAVRSVQNQSSADWELIIADNASTDATAGVARELASSDDRIIYFRNPENLGLSGNLNKLLSTARGRWVGFLPADDEYLPGLFSLLDKETQDSLLSLWICAHDSVHPSRTDTIQPFASPRTWKMDELARLLFLRGNLFGELSCFFFRREDGLRVPGGFGSESQTLDLRFWIHLALANPDSHARYSPGVMVKAHQHEQSESSKYRRNSAHWVELFRFFQEMSALPWPKTVIIRQAVRATYCLARHGMNLPAHERLNSLRRVGGTWANIFHRSISSPPGAACK